jgi:hypothetical protein
LLILIVIIECFLQAFLKIGERCRSLKATLNQVAEHLWEVYHAPDASTFRSLGEEMGQWAEQNTTGYLQEAILKLCAKVDPMVTPAARAATIRLVPRTTT